MVNKFFSKSTYKKRRKKHKANKVAVSYVHAALFRIIHFELEFELRVRGHPLALFRLRFTVSSGKARPHYLLPALASRTPEQQNDRLRKVLKVVVPVQRPIRLKHNRAKNLHADDSIQKEQHANQQANIR